MSGALRPSSILIVDDSPETLRLLTALLRRGGLVPRPVTSGRLAIEAASVDPPDLVLLDIGMPQMSGFEVCRWFKQHAALSPIPVIFISGRMDNDDKMEAFRVGGVDYIAKPFQDQEVLARVHTHLSLRQLQVELLSHTQDLEQRIAEQVKAMTVSQSATIFALAKLAQTRDDETGQHVERVSTFARALAERMRALGLHAGVLDEAFVEHIFQTASLHDIGKVGTPDAILLKPGKLTSEEFNIMKKHCGLGGDTLAAVLKRHPDNQFLRVGVEVARSHHEKWDGSGYPDALAGAAIPLAARIVALADFYDALTSKRCYRPAVSHEETCQLIAKGKGAHFDPDVADTFQALHAEFWQIRREMHSE